MIKLILLGVLVLFALGYIYTFVGDFWRNRHNLSQHSWWKFILLGLVTDFFDTLGIGNFAPTASAFKLGKLVDDKLIPGTMNAGHCLPVIAEALIFMTVIQVDTLTLVLMVVAAIIGAVWGAGIVARMNVKAIRIGMGIALLAVAFVLLAGLLKWMPSGGMATGLYGAKLVFSVFINFILGALMTIGVGQYAPCMALVYSLGMSPKAAFPIMMSSCAFLMPAGSVKFIKENSIDRKAAMGITIGGIPGVLLAAYIITSLPLTLLKWVVFAVLVYTAATMIRSGLKTAKDRLEARLSASTAV
jgi:uncharacterized membrane protein YfcA